MTLTTSAPWQELDPATFRAGVANVVRRLRRRHGRCEYFAAVEFTTGRSASSGGHRRLHAHALLKLAGDRRHDVVELGREVRSTWRATTGDYVVELAELVSPGAALGYLGLHHRKPAQAPPATWRGMTERASRGYWSTPIAELRARARAELAAESRAWGTGTTVTEAALALEIEGAPELLRVTTHHGATLLEPVGHVGN